MKVINLSLLCFYSLLLYGHPVEINITSLWQNLDNDEHSQIQFGSKLILAGIITIKKYVQIPVKLTKLQLTWHGDHISRLHASLYYKKPLDNIMAIEKNLICDSQWYTTEQQLLLPFNQKFNLESVTTFGLVLTVPAELEEILKKGHFELESAFLPDELQQHITHQKYTLVWS